MDSDPSKTESLSISQIFGGYLASCLVFPSSRRYVYPLELRNMPKISSTFVLQENSNTLRRSMVESYLSLNFKMRSISITDPLPHSLNQNGLGIHISTLFKYFFVVERIVYLTSQPSSCPQFTNTLKTAIFTAFFTLSPWLSITRSRPANTVIFPL